MQLPTPDTWYNHLGYFVFSIEGETHWTWWGYGLSDYLPSWITRILHVAVLFCVGLLAIVGVRIPWLVPPLARLTGVVGLIACAAIVLGVVGWPSYVCFYSWPLVGGCFLMIWLTRPAPGRRTQWFRTAMLPVLVLLSPDMIVLIVDPPELFLLASPMLPLQLLSLAAVIWIPPLEPNKLRILARRMIPLLLLPVLGVYLLNWAGFLDQDSPHWVILLVPVSIPASWIWVAACLRQRRKPADPALLHFA